jgi:hypothetical protein
VGKIADNSDPHVGLVIDERDWGLTRRTSVWPLLQSGIGLRITSVFESARADVDRLCDDESVATVVLVPSFRKSLDDVRTQVDAVRRGSSSRRVILLDTFDQSSSPLLPAVETVDRYVKKAVLADRSRYAEPFAGGYIFSDWVQRHLNLPLDGWSFGTTLAPELAGRIVVGFGFAAGLPFRKLMSLSRFTPWPWSWRAVDLNLRLGVVSSAHRQSWYARYRNWCVDFARQSLPGFKLSPTDRVGYWRYVADLWQSRMVLSPFGYGELCLRDVEAICAGALLLKPSVEHLQTSPDLYQPYKTYVPLKWDLSDLPEKVSHYLAHADESRRIVRTAHETLLQYQLSGWQSDVRRTIE